MTLFKGIVQGAPGTGKTALACALAEAGYQIIRCAFEPGEEVFDAYCSPAGRSRIHTLMFEDQWTLGSEGLERVAQGMAAFEDFIYNGFYGGRNETPLGKPAAWDIDTVVMVDTLTSAGECAEARALKVDSSTREGKHLGRAAQSQERCCELLVGARRRHHTLVLSHLRLISPKAESGYKDETALQKQIKRERAQLEDTGYFPTAVTPGIARNFAGHFPFCLLAEEDPTAKHASQRVLRTKPVVGYQIKCPLDVPDKLPIETGLLTIFKKLEAKDEAARS